MSNGSCLSAFVEKLTDQAIAAALRHLRRWQSTRDIQVGEWVCICRKCCFEVSEGRIWWALPEKGTLLKRRAKYHHNSKGFSLGIGEYFPGYSTFFSPHEVLRTLEQQLLRRIPRSNDDGVPLPQVPSNVVEVNGCNWAIENGRDIHHRSSAEAVEGWGHPISDDYDGYLADGGPRMDVFDQLSAGLPRNDGADVLANCSCDAIPEQYRNGVDEVKFAKISSAQCALTSACFQKLMTRF